MCDCDEFSSCKLIVKNEWIYWIEYMIQILEPMKINENKELMKIIFLMNFKELNELITKFEQEIFWLWINWINWNKEKTRKLIDPTNYYWFQLIILPKN